MIDQRTVAQRQFLIKRFMANDKGYQDASILADKILQLHPAKRYIILVLVWIFF